MIEQPQISPHPERIGEYILDKDYSYEWEKDGEKYKLVVPKGFEFDLASVPRIFWTFTGITPSRLRWAAPILHDLVYEHQGKLPLGSYFIHDGGKWVVSNIVWSRKSADRLFCRVMRDDGIPRFNRRMAYRAVRLGGWVAWRT